jgi:MOSC domain-containing protein YiiM
VFSGELVAIGVASTGQGTMMEVDTVEALGAQGLAGDRYAELKGTFQRGHIEPKQQVTLIELEAIDAAAAEYKLEISHLATRRNLLTRGVPLNHLIDREFWVGDVKLRGVKLCEPCKHLEKLSGAGLVEALRHRGGLRAEVSHGGMLRVGDRIRPVD